MVKFDIDITSYDDGISSHRVELSFSKEQIEIIKIAAQAIEKLQNKISEKYSEEKYSARGIELKLPVAKWKGEEYFYKTNHTTILVHPNSFRISTHTDESFC